MSGFVQNIKNLIYRHHCILFIISATVFTAIMSVNYSISLKYDGYIAQDYNVRPLYALIAVLIMFPVYIFLVRKTDFVSKTLEGVSCKKTAVVLFFVFFIIVQMIKDTFKNYEHIKVSSFGKILEIKFVDEHLILFVTVGCVCCAFAIFVLYSYLFNVIFDFICDFKLKITSTEKNYVFATLTFCITMIFYFYQRAWGQWGALDLVYQNDSIFLYEHYYPVFSYGYDFDWDIGNGGIRHPMATLFTYPIYIIVSLLSNILFFVPNIVPILYAIINSLLLIITVVMLVRITNNDWLYLIFTCSYPFLFYSVFIEKYQLAVFFIVAYLYYVLMPKKKEQQKITLVAASGVMITSAFCGFAYGSNETVKKRILDYLSLFACFIFSLIGTGRISYILEFKYLKDQNYLMFFGAGDSTFYNKICSYSNMLVSCFCPIPYEATDKNFFWIGHSTVFNYWSIPIILFIVVGFIKNYKKSYVKVLMLWILWSFLQGVLGSGSPLFNLYFAWAIIPMTLIGIDTLVKKKELRDMAYCIIVAMMLYKNIIHMKDLFDYLVLKTPL